MLKDLKSLDSCSEHGKKYIVEEHHSGDLVCTKCGVIICDRMISDEAEWRNFGDDSMADKWKRSRIGGTANSLLSDAANLGTSIRMESGSDGSRFASTIKGHYKRRSVDNAITRGLDAICTMATRIHLAESVIGVAQQLYGRSYQQMKLKGNQMFYDAKVPACIYIACRVEECSRSSKEIAQISEISVRELRTAIKRVLNILDMNLKPLDTSVMIDRYVNHLGLSDNETKKVQKRAKIISAETQNKMNADKCLPETIIGGQIFLALHEQTNGVLKKDLHTKIGSALGVSSGSIARSSRLLNR